MREWLLGILVAVGTAVLLFAFDRAFPAEPKVIIEKEVVRDTLSDWQVLTMAIAFTESRFKEDAVGSSNDTGLLQIRPIYIQEVNRLTGKTFTIEDAMDADISLEIFNLMQDARNPEKDLDSAIRLHNKSPYYRRVVLDNMNLIRRAEEVRRKIINFGEYERDE